MSCSVEGRRQKTKRKEKVSKEPISKEEVKVRLFDSTNLEGLRLPLSMRQKTKRKEKVSKEEEKEPPTLKLSEKVWIQEPISQEEEKEPPILKLSDIPGFPDSFASWGIPKYPDPDAVWEPPKNPVPPPHYECCSNRTCTFPPRPPLDARGCLLSVKCLLPGLECGICGAVHWTSSCPYRISIPPNGRLINHLNFKVVCVCNRDVEDVAVGCTNDLHVPGLPMRVVDNYKMPPFKLVDDPFPPQVPIPFQNDISLDDLSADDWDLSDDDW